MNPGERLSHFLSFFLPSFLYFFLSFSLPPPLSLSLALCVTPPLPVASRGADLPCQSLLVDIGPGSTKAGCQALAVSLEQAHSGS